MKARAKLKETKWKKVAGMWEGPMELPIKTPEQQAVSSEVLHILDRSDFISQVNGQEGWVKFALTDKGKENLDQLLSIHDANGVGQGRGS